MLKSIHTWYGDKFFEWYVRHIIHKDFHALKWDAPEPEKDKSILILGNHFSWWDGFFIDYVNRRFFKKKFHVMMLEEELATRKPMQYWGAFSIRKNHRSIFETFDYVAELLEDPQNLVLIFPQGKLHSMHVDEIKYQKGFLKIMQNLTNPVKILFSTAFTEYLAERKPEVFMYFEEYKSNDFSVEAVEKAHNILYRNCKAKHQEISV